MELENKSVECPLCHKVVTADEAVAMLLTRANASPLEKMDADSALILICPHCRILFCDPVQYEIIKQIQKL